MAWTLYAYTRGSVSLYEGSYLNQNLAENAADKAVGDGYITLPDAAAGPAWLMPFACGEILALYVVEETDPGANTTHTDALDGLDIG